MIDPESYMYLAIFNSIDGVQDSVYDGFTLMVAVTPSRNRSLVHIILDQLPHNRVWNVTLQAYGCKEHTLANQIELGT